MENLCPSWCFVCVLTPQLLLPLHLSVQEGGLFKKLCDLWPLLVLLGGVEDSDLGLLGQKLTDGMNRKHDLLHAAVLAHNLDTQKWHHWSRVCQQVLYIHYICLTSQYSKDTVVLLVLVPLSEQSAAHSTPVGPVPPQLLVLRTLTSGTKDGCSGSAVDIQILLLDHCSTAPTLLQ